MLSNPDQIFLHAELLHAVFLYTNTCSGKDKLMYARAGGKSGLLVKISSQKLLPNYYVQFIHEDICSDTANRSILC